VLGKLKFKKGTSFQVAEVNTKTEMLGELASSAVELELN
jgi:hypothetical protein